MGWKFVAAVLQLAVGSLGQLKMNDGTACPRYIIDVRSKSEVDGGAARCAWKTNDFINLDWNEQTAESFVAQVEQIVKHPNANDAATMGDDYKNTPIWVYCASGARASNAVEALVTAGWGSVTNAGGWYTDKERLENVCNKCHCPRFVIDVRTPQEVELGTVSCAHVFNWRAHSDLGCADSVFTDFVTKTLGATFTDHIRVFCKSGNRANSAIQALADAGYQNVDNGLGYNISVGNYENLESLCHSDCTDSIAQPCSGNCIHSYPDTYVLVL